MLNLNELNGFGVSAGDVVPPITYTNTWGITNNGSTSTTISNAALVPGDKTLILGVMQSDNGGRARTTTAVDIGGVAGVLRASASNGEEYHSNMTFWEVQTSLEVATIIIYRTGGGGIHGAGVARLWTFATPLGAPDSVLVGDGTITKYQGGVVLALANGFIGAPYISGIANNSAAYWVNVSAHEMPLGPSGPASVSHGPVTHYYNQMMLAVSWAL